MKKDKIAIRFLFAVVALLSCFFSLFAFFSSAISYTPVGVTEKDELNGADILDELGIEISEAEREYLVLYGDFSLSYPSYISTAYITTDYSEEEKRLTVTAREYKYFSEDDFEVVYRPIDVQLHGKKYPLSADGSVVIDGVEKGSDNSVSVLYSADFIVDVKTVNRLLNLAYNDVNGSPSLEEKIENLRSESIAAREEYFKNAQKYEEYLVALSEYEVALAVYKKYLSEKRIYDDAYSEYLEYVCALEDYEAAKKSYADYLDAKNKYYSDYALYLQYLDYAEKYQSKIDEYDRYIKKISVVKAQLDIINQTKTPMTHLSRTIYAAIMGDTVTSVIENKDAIANEIVGASAAAVDRAGAATVNLRSLLEGYFSYESDAERYYYYTLNYEGFRDNFSDLLRCLDNLYMNKRVRGILISQGKQEKYLILLAQLYCVANALSDGPVQNFDGTGCFDASYIIGKGYPDAKSPKEILGTIYITDADAAAPISGGYPVEVEKPEFTLMSEPVAPTPVIMPIAPEAVERPVAPELVEEPIAPQKVEKPMEEPKLYEPDELLIKIIEEFKAKECRVELSEALFITRQKSVRKSFFGASEVNVRYFDREYSSNGDPILLYQTTVEKGTYADYFGNLPYKAEDSEAIYTFSHWTDADGNPVDLTSPITDIDVYPAFKAEYKPYEVVWVVGGKVYTENPGVPTRPHDSTYYYDFFGWNSQRDEKTGNITYTAIFEKRHIMPLYGDTGAIVTFEGSNYIVDTGNYVGNLDVSGILSIASEKGGVIINTSRGSIFFSYAETIRMKEMNVQTLSLSVILRSSGGYTYNLSAYSDSVDEPCSVRATVTLPCDISGRKGFSLYYETSEGKNYVRANSIDTSISFVMSSGTNYVAKIEHSLGIIPSEFVPLILTASDASPGDTVSVSVDVPNGITFVGVYLIPEGGNKTYIGESFTMPDCDVLVGVDAYPTEYTVTFLSDGKIIHSYVCHYGDVPTAPPDPIKAATSVYTFEFVGWSGEFVPVTSDVTYSALYSAQKVPNSDTGGIQISEEVMKKILSYAIPISFSVFILLAAGIILIIALRKRRKACQKNQNSASDGAKK